MTGIDIIIFTIYLTFLGGIWYYLHRITEKISKENTQLLIQNHDMARRLSILIELTDGIEELVKDNPGRTPDMSRIIEELRSITK